MHSITLTAVLVAAAPASAHADNALRPERIPNKARQLAERGRTHHDAGDYAAAIAAFKEAYVLAPSPSLLFNIAQSYRLAGDCDEASWMYRRFLDTSPIGEHRRLAETHLETVEKCGRGGLKVSAPQPKRDDAPVPEPTPVRLAATFTSEDRARRYKKIGVGVAVGGGAALIGAAIFALDAHDAEQTVAETYRRGGNWSDIAEADARGRRSSAVATVLGVGGGLAVASGVVLFAVGRHYEPAHRVAVTPTARGARVAWTWEF